MTGFEGYLRGDTILLLAILAVARVSNPQVFSLRWPLELSTPLDSAGRLRWRRGGGLLLHLFGTAAPNGSGSGESALTRQIPMFLQFLHVVKMRCDAVTLRHLLRLLIPFFFNFFILWSVDLWNLPNDSRAIASQTLRARCQLEPLKDSHWKTYRASLSRNIPMLFCLVLKFNLFVFTLRFCLCSGSLCDSSFVVSILFQNKKHAQKRLKIIIEVVEKFSPGLISPKKFWGSTSQSWIEIKNYNLEMFHLMQSAWSLIPWHRGLCIQPLWHCWNM